MSIFIENLDDHLLGEIFMLLPKEIRKIAKVCPKFRNAIEKHPILKHVHNIENSKLCEFATCAELPELVEYALVHKFRIGESCEFAALNGNFKLLDLLYEKKVKRECVISEYEPESDCDSGDPHDILWKRCCCNAIKNDNVECLQCLHVIDSCEELENVLFEATFKNYSFGCFKYLYENEYDLSKYGVTHNYSGIDAAISAFGIKFIKYYHNTEHRLHEDMFAIATKCANFECVKYLYEHKCVFTHDEFLFAVEKFGIEMIELYLTDHHDELSHKLYEVSIDSGNYELLEYLIDHGCKITTESVNYIFDKKCKRPYKKQCKDPQLEHYGLDETSMKFIKRIRDTEYKFNEDNLRHLIMYDTFSGFEYVSKIIKPSQKIIDDIVNRGNLVFIRYLFENGIIGSEKSIAVSESFCDVGNANGIKYLVDNNKLEISDNCIHFVLKHDDGDLLKYLHENGLKFTKEMIVRSVEMKSLSCFRLIIKEGCPFTVDEFSKIKKVSGNSIHKSMKKILYNRENDIEEPTVPILYFNS